MFGGVASLVISITINSPQNLPPVLCLQATQTSLLSKPNRRLNEYTYARMGFGWMTRRNAFNQPPRARDRNYKYTPTLRPQKYLRVIASPVRKPVRRYRPSQQRCTRFFHYPPHRNHIPPCYGIAAKKAVQPTQLTNLGNAKNLEIPAVPPMRRVRTRSKFPETPHPTRRALVVRKEKY